MKYKTIYSNNYVVEIYLDNNVYKLEGMIDTGNHLEDPYKKRGVILVNINIDYTKYKYLYVPYHALNYNGLIPCIKPDKIIIDNKVYLADSRGDEYSTKYEWFVWELGKKITCTRVKDGVLYLCTNDGVYTLTNTNATRDVSAYWTTPLDEFNYPHYMKTTNKRGCITDIHGSSVNIAVRTNGNEDFEDIVTHTDISSYVVNRIKKKKWKAIQLKFSSNEPFELYSSTIEAYVGGYLKR